MSTREMAPEPGDVLDLQRYSPDELASFDAGRDIYLRQCSTCHSIEPINRYTLSRWSRIIPDMSKESELNAEEERQLTDYIMTIRRAMPDPG